MRALVNTTFAFAKHHENLAANGMFDVAEPRKIYRQAKIFQERSPKEQSVYVNRAEGQRIKSLEAELAHYRLMVDRLVQERTARLDRRLAILESCNSSLGENYHKMHQMYLELLTKK